MTAPQPSLRVILCAPEASASDSGPQSCASYSSVVAASSNLETGTVDTASEDFTSSVVCRHDSQEPQPRSYSKLTFHLSLSKPAVLNLVAGLFADHPDLIEGFGVFLPPPQEPPRGYFNRALPSRPLYRPQNATADNDDDGASKTTAVPSDNIRPNSPDEIRGRKLWKRRPRSPEEDEESDAGSVEVERDGWGRPLWRNPDGSR